MLKNNKKTLISEFQLSMAVISIVSLLLIFYHLSQGSVSSPDTGTFSRWADLLISHDFNFFRYYSENNFVTPSYFYTVPVTFVALLKVIFGDAWKVVFFFFNLVLLCGCLVLTYKILRLLLMPSICCALATGVLLLSDAYLVWPRYILTDTIFSVSVLFLLFLIITRLNAKNSVRLKFSVTDLGVMLMGGFIIFTRPTAAPYVIGLLSGWILIVFRLEQKLFTYRNVAVACVGLLVVGGVFSATLYWAQIFTPLDVRQLSWLGEMHLEGMVVHDRPETWTSPPESWLGIFKIYWLKVLHFWAPWAESYSFVHKLANGLFWSFCAGAILAWPLVRNRLEPNQQIYLILLLITAVFVTAFHAATIIDYDWRYRYPLVIPVLIGASCVYWQMFIWLMQAQGKGRDER